MVTFDVSVGAEVARLAALRSYGLLDTEPEEAFDDLVRLAASICATPISAVSLVDADRQWFKARIGLDVTQTPRSVSFCDYAMREDDLMVVPDAALDPRFARNPLVKGDPWIRFYAAAPLVSPEGHPLGALCVIDTTPRTLNEEQAVALRLMGRQVAAQLALRRTMHTLTASEKRFRAVFDRAPIGMVLMSVDEQRFGTLLEVNEEFASLLGDEPASLEGRSLSEFVDTADLSAIRGAFNNLAVAGDRRAEYRVQCSFRTVAAERLLVRMAGSWIDEETGPPTKAVVHVEDITTARAAQDQLTYLATHDPLTGLFNRAQIIGWLQDAQVHAQGAAPGYIAVLFIDLDRFKIVNDSLGHQCGDELLVTVAHRLSQVVRSIDLVARIGGDEFVIICNDMGSTAVTAASRAEALAQRVAEAIAAPVTLGEVEVFVSASIGIALGGDSELSPEDLIRDADTAMYASKNRGSGRIELFNTGLRAKSVQRQTLDSGLHRALERQELEIFYQPIIQLASGLGVGAEALLRWRHPDRGLLGPDAFIAVAEETGQIVPIGNWVLQKACRDMANWHAETGGQPTVAVNVSARQLSHGGLATAVAAALAASGLAPDALHLELTETALFDLSGAARSQLDLIRALGVELGIDDFGTGYASLTYLKNLPVDFLKIDRSFVAGLGSSPSDTAIVAGVINLASSLGLKVIAEGIETSYQAEQLISMGCGYAQGFLYSRPQSAESLKEHYPIRSFAQRVTTGRPKRPKTSSVAWKPTPESLRFPADLSRQLGSPRLSSRGAARAVQNTSENDDATPAGSLAAHDPRPIRANAPPKGP